MTRCWYVFALTAFLLAGFAATPLFAAPAKPPAARMLYLVRHGAYDSEVSTTDGLGSGLVPIGVAQARLLAARLAALPGPWDQLLASPMRRAQDTARVIANDLDLSLENVPELAECTPRTRRTELTSKETPSEMQACSAKLDRFFTARFRPARGREQRELVVCHGNVIRYLVTKALGVDTAAWLEMSVGHASLTVIRVEADGRFKVLAVGDVGHLPFNMQTGATGDSSRDLAVP